MNTTFKNFNKDLTYHTSGFYFLICNNKRYVGVSIDIKKRLQIHKAKLIRGNHDNVYLQRAFTKYGIQSFQIEVTECIDIYNKEQLLIKEYNTLAPNGYNMTPGGEGMNAKILYHIPWDIVNPAGNCFTVTNMNEFAREHNLTDYGLCCLRLGRFKSHRGWKRKDFIPNKQPTLLEKRGKTYCIKDPNGIVYNITNENQFAREHGLCVVTLQRLRNKQIKSTYGWTLIF